MVVVGSQIRDGKAAENMEERRQIEMYARGGKQNLKEWIGCVEYE